jgi:hypothetical protein
MPRSCRHQRFVLGLYYGDFERGQARRPKNANPPGLASFKIPPLRYARAGDNFPQQSWVRGVASHSPPREEEEIRTRSQGGCHIYMPLGSSTGVAPPTTPYSLTCVCIRWVSRIEAAMTPAIYEARCQPLPPRENPNSLCPPALFLPPNVLLHRPPGGAFLPSGCPTTLLEAPGASSERELALRPGPPAGGCALREGHNTSDYSVRILSALSSPRWWAAARPSLPTSKGRGSPPATRRRKKRDLMHARVLWPGRPGPRRGSRSSGA